MIGAEEINPSLCGMVRLTEGFGMTSRVGSLLHLAWRASGSWGRAAGRQLFTGMSGVNAEMGEARLLCGQIILYPGRQMLSRREGTHVRSLEKLFLYVGLSLDNFFHPPTTTPSLPPPHQPLLPPSAVSSEKQGRIVEKRLQLVQAQCLGSHLSLTVAFGNYTRTCFSALL